MQKEDIDLKVREAARILDIEELLERKPKELIWWAKTEGSVRSCHRK